MNSGTPDQSASSGNQVEDLKLLDIAIILAKRKRLVFGLPLVVAVVAIVVSLIIPKSYLATARVLPPQQQSTSAALLNQLGAFANLAGGSLGLKNPADLYVGMLKSRTVADALIARFDLMQIYETKTLYDTRKALEAQSTIAVGKDGIISVQVEDEEPKRAAAIANAYVDELNKLTQTVAVTEASLRRVFFERQLIAAKDQLANAEVALRQTQESTGLIKLDEQAKAIIENVARLRGQVAVKEVQLTTMRSFATEQNPELIRVQQELVGLRAQLGNAEKQRNSKDADIFVPTGKVPEAGLEYLRKLREVKYQETLFELLAKQYELAKIDEAKEGSVVQVVDKAIPPDKKYKPRRALIVIVSFLGALICAVFFAFFREWLGNIAKSREDVARLDMLRQFLRGK